MKLYKTIIIDDEQLAIDVITHYLSIHQNYKVVEVFTDPVKAFNYLKNNDIDLAFTDIAMPDLSGIELIKLAGKKTQFILTTSFSEYAIESFDLSVVDYLLKPISRERFARALDRFENLSIENSVDVEASFFVKDGDEFVKIFIHEIDYVEGMKDYAKIVCGKRYHMALKTLKSIETVLKPHGFQRIHKSFIIPLNKIIQSNNRSVLINNQEIPVGPGYREELKKFLNSRKL